VSFSVGVITQRHLSTISATCIVTLAIAGCSKESKVAAPEAQSAASTQPVMFPHAPICDMDCMRQKQIARQQKSVDDIVSKRLAAANSALPPSAATANVVYFEPKTNFDLGVLYQAFGKPMSEEEVGQQFNSVQVAGDLSQKIAKRHEAFARLTAGVDALKGNRFVLLKNVPFVLNPVDEATKSFDMSGIANRGFGMGNDGTTHFSNSIVLANSVAASRWTIPDLDSAAKVDGLRARNLNREADVYLEIAGTAPDDTKLLNAKALKVVVHSREGVQIGVFTPQDTAQ
jgi:hypothetical protein